MDVLRQFLRFGLVGASGFALDTATLFLLRSTLGLYGAGGVAYVVAASSNWALNRWWTFATAPSAPAARQWSAYLLANTLGFAINRGIYAACIWQSPIAAAYPVLALAAGTAAGLVVNFVLARRVFEARKQALLF